MNYFPTTELEAVNIMLETIGEAPVNSLDVSGLADAAVAKSVLFRSSREVQARGWWFNAEEDITLYPGLDGQILLPMNALQVDANAQNQEMDVVPRGTRLYDKKTHSYVFAAPVRLDIVFFLSFEELPEPARSYIALKAARRFQAKVLGSETIHAFSKEDEEEALARLNEAEVLNGDYNMLTDSASTRDVLLRR